MVASRFVIKKLSEIKINSVPKNTNDLCKNTTENNYSPHAGSVIIGEYSPQSCTENLNAFGRAFSNVGQ
jgi:hypothetical protein